MKKMFRLAAMFLMAGAMFTACGGDEKVTPGGGDAPGPGGNFPEDIVITTASEGVVKAGLPDQILIEGENFDPERDLIFMGYEDGGKLQLMPVNTEFLTVKPKRISFGVNIADDITTKTIKVYLNRPGYDDMPLTKDITFKMPDVSEGYIPDPGFRSTLMSTHDVNGNPAIAALFNKYGLIDVAQAGLLKKCGVKDYGLNLYASTAKSLEGIELFKSIKGTVPFWGMGEIEEIDLSKWESNAESDPAIFANGLPKLKKFIASPGGFRFDLYECPNLAYVDLSHAKKAYNIQLWYDSSPTTYTSVTYLDMRKDRSGTEMGGPEEGEGKPGWKGYPLKATSENEFCPFLSGSWFKVADNSHILVDYQFLTDKWGVNSGYGTIYSAWQRGATIDVYSSKDISKKLGTVPMYSENDKALMPIGQENGWVPSEIE